MPLRYVIDKERRLVHTTGWDRLTFAQSRSYQDQLLNDPDFDSEFNQLVDLSALTGPGMSIEETKLLATRSGFAPTSRRAFVAPDPAVFGMSRLFEAYNEMSKARSQIRVFSDLPAALKWLGVETLSPTSE
jgi:hypothetical protein